MGNDVSRLPSDGEWRNTPGGGGINFTSSSVRSEIFTQEDGTVQERRTVTTTGPDGIPREETVIKDISSNSGTNSGNNFILSPPNQNTEPRRG